MFEKYRNGTVHPLREQLLSQKKALLSMISQSLIFSKTKFQHSVTTIHSFLHVFLSRHFPCDCFVKIDKVKNLWLFVLFGAKDERRTTNQPEISCPSWKNSN